MIYLGLVKREEKPHTENKEQSRYRKIRGDRKLKNWALIIKMIDLI